MDLTAAWQELARFQETSIATSTHIYAKDQENALVHKFLADIPVATLFACLQDASDRGSDKQVGMLPYEAARTAFDWQITLKNR